MRGGGRIGRGALARGDGSSGGRASPQLRGDACPPIEEMPQTLQEVPQSTDIMAHTADQDQEMGEDIDEEHADRPPSPETCDDSTLPLCRVREDRRRYFLIQFLLNVYNYLFHFS